VWEALGGTGKRISVRGQTPAKIQDLTRKITEAKRVGNTAQDIEHLPSKLEALSSSPSTTKKQKQQPKTENKQKTIKRLGRLA
jgi:hypothetical protein